MMAHEEKVKKYIKVTAEVDDCRADVGLSALAPEDQELTSLRLIIIPFLPP